MRPGGEKNKGVQLVIGGDNLPSLVVIGLTDLPNIGGASGPPGPPSSGITEIISLQKFDDIFAVN